jgi:iron complex transport system substrate-binding protein
MEHQDPTRRRLLGAMLAAAGAAALAGCGDSRAAAPATAGGLTLTDQQGRTLRLDRPAARVVTIPMPAASLLVAVDRGTGHLAGMHKASWTAMKDGIMGRMFPAALKIPHEVATEDFTPNVESVRALDPDVVVQWDESALTEPLQNAGLTVLSLTNNGRQEDVDAWTALFAAMLGKPGRAVEMKSRSDAELRRIKALAAGRSGPSILYFNRFKQGLKVAGHNTYNDFYIKLVGGSNPATGDQGTAGTGMVGTEVEQVLAWNPEVILLGNFDDAVPQDIYTDPVYREVAAVRSRRVYKVPLGGYRWDPPSQESPLMWHWLTDIAFPQQDRSGLRATVAAYFDFLYAYRTTDADIDRILQQDANAGSADYGQFDAP